VTVSPRCRIRNDSNDYLSTIEHLYAGIHPDDRARVRQTYDSAQFRKVDFEADYRIGSLRTAQSNLHTIGHPVLNESGDVVEYVGTGMDVTEQRQSRLKLRMLEEIKRLKDRLMTRTWR
jgi:hypothetical protein